MLEARGRRLFQAKILNLQPALGKTHDIRVERVASSIQKILRDSLIN